jgi:fatty-acyl-CoA synthase
MITNVAALVETNAATMPDRVAIVDGDQQLSYRDLAERTLAMAAVLTAHGVTPGDRVAIRMRNRSEFLISSFAAWKIGAITVPVNTRLHGREVRFILDHSDAVCIITEAELATPDASDGHPAPVIVVDDLDLAAGSPSTPRAAVDRLATSVTHGEPVQRLMYTSGTTSRPKAVVITHQMVVHNMLTQVRDLGLTGDDRVLVPGPLFHIAAFDAPGIAVLFLGGTLVLHRRFDADEVLRSIERERITGTVLVHPMGDRIVAAADPNAAYDSMRWLSVGARSPVTARRMREIFPSARLVQGYGLTEACGTVTSLRNRPDKVGTVGSPVAFVEVAILDEGGSTVPIGEQGEVGVRGPKVSRSYWNAPSGPFSESEWLPTGDIGVLDEDGFLTLVDRKKDMIRTGGENVASSEIERVLATHPSVADIAVVAAQDRRWGEVPVAFIVPVPGSTPSPDDFEAHCARHLAKFKVPKRYVVVEELPRTATGKVEKIKLRRLIDPAPDLEGSMTETTTPGGTR